MLKHSKLSFFSCTLISLLLSHTTQACTRVLYMPKDKPVMVGRNMDWFEDMKTNMYVLPEGITRSGLDKDNPLHWTAKYGSVVAVAYDAITTEGMNEKGLSAQANGLRNSDYGKRDVSLPGLSILLWAQFYLDNFATVAEAVHYTETTPFQIIPYFDPKIKQNIDLHLSLEDSSGDSAIVEYTNGKIAIFHDPAYTVMTNEPTYDQQLLNLKQYQGFGGDKPLPGTTVATDRFVRASFYLKHLPEPTSTRAEVAQLFSILHNAGQPYGVPSPERPGISYSIWRTVEDLTNHIYYFDSLTSLNIFYAEVDKFNFKPGAPILKLDMVNTPDLAGNVTDRFKPIN